MEKNISDTCKQYENYLTKINGKNIEIKNKEDLLKAQEVYSNHYVNLAFSDEDILGSLEAMDKQTDDLLEKHIQSGESSLFLSGRNEVVVSPSAKNPGKYQITFFDEKGAVSDNQRETIEEVLKELKGNHCIPLRKDFAEFVSEPKNADIKNRSENNIGVGKRYEMTEKQEDNVQSIVHFHFIDENKKYGMANLESTIDSGVYNLANNLDRRFLHESFDNAIDHILDENSEFLLGYDSIEKDLEENREYFDEEEIERIQEDIELAKENEANIDKVHQAISSKNVDKIEQALFKLDIPGYSLDIQPVETLYDKLIENGYPVSCSGISDSLYTINDFGEEVRISDHVRPSYGENGIYNHEYTNELILDKDKKVTEDDLINEGIEGVRFNGLDDVYLGNNGEDVHEISQDLLERIKENQCLDGNETVEELEELEIDSLVIDELQREQLEIDSSLVQPVIRLDDELEL